MRKKKGGRIGDNDNHDNAYDENMRGEDYKPHLRNIRTIIDKIGEETQVFYDRIIRGQ